MTSRGWITVGSVVGFFVVCVTVAIVGARLSA